MKYLHLIVHDANRFGDYAPEARKLAARDEKRFRAMRVGELIRLGVGWVTEGPLSREEIINTYHGYRSEEITDEQAAEWERHAPPVEER